jgi:hypothetical protein
MVDVVGGIDITLTESTTFGDIAFRPGTNVVPAAAPRPAPRSGRR